MKGSTTKTIQEAIDIYKAIEEPRGGFLINTFLKLCLHCKNHQKGLEIWDDVKILLERGDDSVSYPLLLSLYGRCSLEYAQKIYDDMPDNHKKVDIVSHGLMMKYYIQYQQANKALEMYDNINDDIKDDGIHVSALKACIKSNNFNKGRQIHQSLRNNESVKIQTTLIEFYNHFGKRSTAMDIFNSIKNDEMDIVSISSMMKCFIDNKDYESALDLYDKTMSDYNLKQDDICHVLAVKACINTRNYDKGKMIHQSIKHMMKDKKIYLKNVLINLYGESGDIETAKQIFNSIPSRQRDIDIVNVMMKAYLNNNFSGEAIKLYDKINKIKPNKANIKTDNISHLLAIKACTVAGNFEKGKRIHDVIQAQTVNNIQITTALIDFYGKNNEIDNAVDVFKSIQRNQINTVCINSMMDAYLQNERYQEALYVYNEFCDEMGINKDNTTHMLGIKACSNALEFETGKAIHRILTDANSVLSIPMKTTLIGFYGKTGDIEYAESLYNSINDNLKDIYCVDTMMEAYCNNDMNNECIDLFKNMHTINDRIKPDLVAYVTVLKACTNATSLYYGRKIHEELKENIDERIWRHRNIQIHLINMYGKCGMLQFADEILQDIKDNECYKYMTEIGIWNAMIHAYGRNGDLTKVMEFYDIINEEYGLRPNRKTFILLINACSHYGDIRKAQRIWNEDIKDDEIKYDEYLMSSLIDGMSRKGMLKQGMDLIKQYNEDCGVMWMSLLNGCRKFSDQTLAQEICAEIKQRFPDDENLITNASILLSNILAEADGNSGRVGNVCNVDNDESFAEIDLYGKLYKFDGDMSDDIESKMNELMGNNELYDVEFDDDIVNQCEIHAVIYGLLNTDKEYELVINKRGEIGMSVYKFLKSFSKITDRKVIVSDSNRVYVFENGLCNHDYY